MVNYTDIIDIAEKEPFFDDIDKKKIIEYLKENRYDMDDQAFLNRFDDREKLKLKTKYPDKIVNNVYNELSTYLLKNKIESLSYVRYSENIKTYYDDLFTGGFNFNRQYDYVFNCISQLWLDSQKNPSIFKTSKDFEPILQKRELYRDHFIHSLNVFLLGYYIINKIEPNIFITNMNTNMQEQIDDVTDINLIWMLTSTFHDVAYPIQTIELWLNDLLKTLLGINPNYKINILDIVPPIYLDFMKMISAYNLNQDTKKWTQNDYNKIDWNYYNQFNSEIMNKDHGLISGLMLAHLLAIREGWGDGHLVSKNFLLNQLPACHAISLHNLRNEISFNKFPFAFLLTLCDEIQDWGRPSIDKDKEIFFLKKLDIENSTIPVINIHLHISETRTKQMVDNLSSRMHTDSRLKIRIFNQQGINFLKIE